MTAGRPAARVLVRLHGRVLRVAYRCLRGTLEVRSVHAETDDGRVVEVSPGEMDVDALFVALAVALDASRTDAS